MRLDPQATSVIVRVEVVGPLGSRLVSMAVDTGATYVVVPWRIAEALGYNPAIAPRRITIATVTSVESLPLIKLRWVRALEGEAQDVEAVCHDLASGGTVDGLLGLSFLKHFDIDLHFKRGVLELRGS